MILGALVALAAGGCGKGLYTHVVHSSDGSGGGGIDPGTRSGTGGTGSGTGGTGSGSTSSDTGGSTAGTSGTSSDVTPRLDAAASGAVTGLGNWDSELTIPNGEATLFIPKQTLPTGGPYPVTLTLVSSDGSMPNYGGAIGPIYSITVEGGVWSDSAILSIRVPSDHGVSSQKMGVAYLDKESGGWIAIQTPQPIYDETSRLVRGTVARFPGTRYFAPFETCTKTGQDGGYCRSTLRCSGEACQQ